MAENTTSQTKPGAPSLNQSNKTPRLVWLIVIVVGLLIIGAAGFWAGTAWREANENDNTNSAIQPNANTSVEANVNAAVQANVNADLIVNSNSSANVDISPTNANVSPPVVPAGLTLIDTPTIFVSGLVNNDVQVYDTGPLADSRYQGKHLLLFVVRPEGPYFQPYFYRVVKDGSKYTLIALQSDDPTGQLDPAKYTSDTETIIPSLDYPATLQGPSSRQLLELVPYVNRLFDSSDYKKVFTDEVYGAVYTDATVDKIPSESVYSLSMPKYYGFYLKAPDGTQRTYKLRIDFMSATDETPNLIWSDGAKNYQQYAFTDVNGCGSSNYASVISPADVNLETDLTAIGTSAKGDTIYELKDTNHPLLKSFYKSYNPSEISNGENGQDSYAQFLENRPLIFFVDAFDRLVKGHNTRYQPAAECGKPVIYLYPKTPTEVSVQIEPQGGLSYTDPAYENEWRVRAEPDGRLTDLRSGRMYPYLFWEGRGAIYQAPDKGWVVAQGDVNKFLTDSLGRLGLNQRETADFIEFWEPRLQDAPYYFVSFMGRNVMDRLAPLTVEPKPDTVIRVLMDFKPLDQPIKVESYPLRSVERKGFTVVEWGGVIR